MRKSAMINECQTPIIGILFFSIFLDYINFLLIRLFNIPFSCTQALVKMEDQIQQILSLILKYLSWLHQDNLPLQISNLDQLTIFKSNFSIIITQNMKTTKVCKISYNLQNIRVSLSSPSSIFNLQSYKNHFQILLCILIHNNEDC